MYVPTVRSDESVIASQQRAMLRSAERQTGLLMLSKRLKSAMPLSSRGFDRRSVASEVWVEEGTSNLRDVSTVTSRVC